VTGVIAEIAAGGLTWAKLATALAAVASGLFALYRALVQDRQKLVGDLQDERQWYKEQLVEERQRYEGKLEDVQQKFRGLEADHNQLQGKYEALKQDHDVLKRSHKKLQRSHRRLRHYYEKMRQDLTETMDSGESHDYPHPDELDTPEPPDDGYFSEDPNDSTPGAA